MLKVERYEKIMECLKRSNSVKVNALAELLNVSVDTIRRDLEQLENYGVLDRVHGGAVARAERLEQHVYEMRTIVHSQEKKELAKLVGSVLEDGITIAMCSSSTNVVIARYLAENYNRLTVITNDIDILRELSLNENFKLIFLGGNLDPEENATYGKYCESQIKRYNVDACVISVSGISVDKGLSDFRINQIGIIKEMMDISDQVIVAVDSSKFNKKSCMTVCDFKEVDCIISDSNLEDDIMTKLENNNIRVVTS